MARGKKLGHGTSIDGHALKQEIGEINKEIEEKTDLARKFEEDNEKINERIRRVEASEASLEDKQGILDELEAYRQQVQEEFDLKVLQEIEAKEKEADAIFDQLDKNAATFKEHEEDLKAMQFDAVDGDGSKAAKEAAIKKEFMERTKNEESERLELHIQQIQMIQREMQRNKK